MVTTSTRTRRDAARNCQRVIEVIRRHPTGRISIYGMADKTDLDPRTIYSIVRHLRECGQLQVVEPGRGARPSRYCLD